MSCTHVSILLARRKVKRAAVSLILCESTTQSNLRELFSLFSTALKCLHLLDEVAGLEKQTGEFQGFVAVLQEVGRGPAPRAASEN